MSGIQGKKREFQDNSKMVGVFEARVVAVSPSKEDLQELLGVDIEKDIEYVGEKEVDLGDGDKVMVDSARIAFYVQDVKSKRIFNVSFFLEDRNRHNKDQSKSQFINEVGATTWAEDEEGLQDKKYDWFTKRDVRSAKTGEGELYDFVKNWLQLDYRDPATNLNLDFSKLIKGDVQVLRDQITEDYAGTVTCLAIVTSKDKDGEVKHFQNISNKFSLGGYAIKTFRTKNFTPEVIAAIKAKPKKELKAIDKFVLGVTDAEYPIKGAYSLKELHDFNPEEHLASSGEVLVGDDSDTPFDEDANGF